VTTGVISKVAADTLVMMLLVGCLIPEREIHSQERPCSHVRAKKGAPQGAKNIIRRSMDSKYQDGF
jgi:hypothetical protein